VDILLISDAKHFQRPLNFWLWIGWGGHTPLHNKLFLGEFIPRG
jgi:hypothetical protein